METLSAGQRRRHLQDRRVLLHYLAIKVEDLPARLTTQALSLVVLLECEFAIGVDADHALLETVEHECEVSLEVLASRGFLDARESEIGVWNIVWIDDELVLVV